MISGDRWHLLAQSPKMLWNLLFRARYDFTFDLMPIHLSGMPLNKRLNLLNACLNFAYRRLNPWSWPVHMQIELTNYCNLKCPVCPVGIGAINRKPLSMDTDMFEKLMNEVGSYLLTTSLFAWGEPLLHPQLANILRIAHKHTVSTILSTNGQNLDDKKVINAIINQPPTYLIVAIDGMTNETNSRYRVGARLEPVLEGVHKIAKLKRQEGFHFPILHMRYMVMKHNQHELPRVQEFATKNFFDLLTIRTLSVIDSPETPHQELIPDIKEYRAYEYSGENRIHRNDFICQHAFSFPTVLADGTIIVCEQDYNAQKPYGKLTNNISFGDIWFSKRAVEIRKTVKKNHNSLSFCRNCPYADRDISTCSVLALDLH